MKKQYLYSTIGILFFGLLFSGLPGTLYAQLLDAGSHPKFVTALPIPTRIDATDGGTIEMTMAETVQHLGLYDAQAMPLNTTVWGYGLTEQQVTYPGPTLETEKDMPVDIIWHNQLPTSGHLLPVDYSLHMAHPHSTPAMEFYEAGYIPAVTHLHGGHTESGSDGLPEAWYTQEGMPYLYQGVHNVNGNSYHYDNDQEAATLWYHDHALGTTRLNVYAGLAGFYLLSDAHERQLIKDNILPHNAYTTELVIQDRMFYENGTLFLPAKDGDPFFDGTVEVPDENFAGENTVMAEFFGDFILVNGVAWPYYRVKPRKYRFRLLNGSDSRFYVLQFDNKMEFLQIGTDNGFLPEAVMLKKLVLGPGERADLVVDFTDYENTEVILTNTGPDVPFRGFNSDGTLSDGEGGTLPTANSATTGIIMQFNIDKNLKQKKGFQDALVEEGTTLRPPIEALTDPVTTRKLALFEGEDQYGRLQPLLGVINGDNPKGEQGVVNGSLGWFEEITENPMLNDVEAWEIYNLTEDAHPIHLHLVSFQIVGRAPFEATLNAQEQLEHDGGSGTGGYVVKSSISFNGNEESVNLEEPAPNERGWKDTFIIPPGYMGKVIARFDRPGRYVWHCHILSHEDHEMMRPFHVGPIPVPAQLARQAFDLGNSYPNPFTSSSTVEISVDDATPVYVFLTDKMGMVLFNDEISLEAGTHIYHLELSHLNPGTYYLKIQAKDYTDTQRIVKLNQ